MDGCLNPFGTGQCLSTDGAVQSVAGFNPSQSLWNRAVSFDCTRFEVLRDSEVSIPLEQGSVFRLILETGLLLAENVSIPLEQGSVFRQLVMTWNVFIKISLNPFGTGQCLSTVDNIPPASELSVSIPLEQGSVFRQLTAYQDSAKVWVSIPLEQGSVFRQ